MRQLAGTKTRDRRAHATPLAGLIFGRVQFNRVGNAPRVGIQPRIAGAHLTGAVSLLPRHVLIKPVGKARNIQDHRWPAVLLAGAGFKSHIETLREGIVGESL